MYWTCAKGNGNSVEEVEQGNTGLELKTNLLMQWGINAKLLGHCIMEICGRVGGKEDRGFSKPIPL